MISQGCGYGGDMFWCAAAAAADDPGAGLVGVDRIISHGLWTGPVDSLALNQFGDAGIRLGYQGCIVVERVHFGDHFNDLFRPITAVST